jgi:hypothetical protein
LYMLSTPSTYFLIDTLTWPALAKSRVIPT